MGTNFSRRKETMPEPPSPALTRTTTRSMNTGADLRCARLALHATPEHSRARHRAVVDHAGERFDDFGHDVRRHAHVQRSAKMRVQLSLLPRGRTCGDNAELAPGPREWLASVGARFGRVGRIIDPAEAAVHDAIADLSTMRQDFEKRVRDRLQAVKEAQKSGKKTIRNAEKHLSAASTVPLIAHAGNIRIYEDRVQTPDGTHPLDG